MDPIPNKELEMSEEDESSAPTSILVDNDPIPPSGGQLRRVDQQRPTSPVPSCISMESDRSIELPFNFKVEQHSTEQRVDQQRPTSPVPSCISMESDRSIDLPFNFKVGQHSTEQRIHPESPDSSVKSDRSMDPPFNFKAGHHSTEQRVDLQRPVPSVPSCVSMESDSRSIDTPFNFKEEQHSTEQSDRLPETCDMCQEVLRDPVTTTCGHRFCSECITLYWDQPRPTGDSACPKCGKKTRKEPELLGKTGNSNVQKVKLTFKEETIKRFSSTHEGNGKQKSLLSSIYTTLYITPEESEDFSEEHELRKMMKGLLSPEISLNDIFKPVPGQENQQQILTKGIAGIGKSFSVQKFALDWAEEKANNDIDFVFVLAFRELNMLEGKINLNTLLMEFHPALKEHTKAYTESKVAIILDGLDESRLTLNFPSKVVVKSVTQEASVDVLLTSLIKGKLLPSAHLWITSRAAAANQIPAQYLNMVTEIRGFNDTQKEEYFKNKFAGEPDLADHLISNIQSSQSLCMMCHIPIFCWILADTFVDGGKLKVYGALTEMMSHYLLVQTRRRNKKYDQKIEGDMETLLKSHREQLLGLGRLAFEQLKKNSLIFYEKDFEECNVDITEASIYSGFCAILKEERVFVQKKKVFSFVHLTVQEFFAALYVYDCFINKNTEAICSFLDQEKKPVPSSLLDLLKMTINKVLESKNGQLDFFLRFLLGLTCESNREALSGLLTTPEEGTSSENTRKKILTYLKTRSKGLSPDSCINLFQCMVEMRDNKVKDEIEAFLKLTDRSETELSPLHCSALAYALQVSKEQLEEFDLGSYNTSELGRMRLIPAVTCSIKASLAECNLSEELVRVLAQSLTFPYSTLRDLNLSNSDLLDSGVDVLTAGLKSPNCKLTALSLSGCQVTEKGCKHLDSALRNNPSHLKKLDLSYNHIGKEGVTILSALKNDPQFSLNQFNVDCGGANRIRPGFKKYACVVTFDPRTAHRNLLLSEDNRKVTWVKEEQPYPYPDVPRRFQSVCQVLCREELKDRCYWEAEVSKPWNIGVTYAAIRGEGNKNASRLGSNEKSWSVMCSDKGCFASHDDKKVEISCKDSRFGRLGVYLDWSAGTLAFYKVSIGKTTFLHRFKNEFTESLHVGVEVYPQSSVTLCKLI